MDIYDDSLMLDLSAFALTILLQYYMHCYLLYIMVCLDCISSLAKTEK
jgi:hypothetical protein